MDYAAALAYWYNRIDFEKRPAGPGELKLDRMRALLTRLGDPQDRVKLIHVTGTKGKGSTSAMFASMLRAAGYRTGLFTSPHLSDVRERIRIDGAMIVPDALAQRMTEIAPAIDALTAEGQPPTFFEVGTALGFYHFAQELCDWAVIEVGLGGRFDSTNVCTPKLAVITSVSLDHTAILGDTVDKIAFEKAGIIKPHTLTLNGATEPGPASVIEAVAAERESFVIPIPPGYLDVLKPAVATADGRVEPMHLASDTWSFFVPLLGRHQATNVALATVGLSGLRVVELERFQSVVTEGLAALRIPGRLEWLATSPPTLLDCAHNVASVQALVATVDESLPAGPKTLVFAASNDKDIAGMIRVLAPVFDRFIFTRYGDNPRAVPPESLRDLLRAERPDAMVECVSSAADAWCRAAEVGDIIVVAGSVFLAGELRPLLLARSSR